MSRHLPVSRSLAIALAALAIALISSNSAAAGRGGSVTSEATPTDTLAAGALIWGDSLCDGALDLADALETLKIALAFPPQNNPPCPVRGAGILIGGASHNWGDNDCDDSVGPQDALPIIAHFAQLTMHFPECPDVGDAVLLDN